MDFRKKTIKKQTIGLSLMLLLIVSSFFIAACGGGGGDSDPEPGQKEETQDENMPEPAGQNLPGDILQTGTFFNGNVEGIRYETASMSGVIERGDTFSYKEGELVSFFAGSILLGRVTGKNVIFPEDFINYNSLYKTEQAVNICILLLSLDKDNNNENGIQLDTEALSEIENSDFNFSMATEEFVTSKQLVDAFASLNNEKTPEDTPYSPVDESVSAQFIENVSEDFDPYPVANAGPDIVAEIGSLITLDGSGSYDLNNSLLVYDWSMKTKPENSNAVLINPETVATEFLADVKGEYKITLSVMDNSFQMATTMVTVTITDGKTPDNTPPIANAGQDQHVESGRIELSGDGSEDPDGDVLSYQWSIESQPEGGIKYLWDSNTADISFQADVEGTYVVKLVVNDGYTDSQPDYVSIVVKDEGVVYDGFVVLLQPEDVAALEGYTRIKGSLVFGSSLYLDDSNPITDFSGLESLVKIDGDLGIRSRHLQNMDGLNNLATIGGNLLIEHSSELVNIKGLNNLTNVGGDVEILSNSSLSAIDGFAKLKTIEGALRLTENEFLETVNGMKNLATIGENLSVGRSTNLKKIDGLTKLYSIGGSLYLSDNDELMEVDFPSLQLIGNGISFRSCSTTSAKFGKLIEVQYIKIEKMNQLADFTLGPDIVSIKEVLMDGNENLKSMDFLNISKIDSLVMKNNSSLSSITANALKELNELTLYSNSLLGKVLLGNLGTLDKLNISYNSMLTDIEVNSLEFCTDFILKNNRQLTTMQFDSLTAIGHKMEIIGCDALLNLGGLNNLESVSGEHPSETELVIRENSSLASLEGLNKLKVVDGTLEIYDCDEIVNLSGLRNLETVTYDLIVTRNSNMINLSGIDKLETLGHDLNISNNYKMENLNGLEGITALRDLRVSSNNMLTDLSSLHNLCTVTREFYFTRNKNLCNETIENLKEIITSCPEGGIAGKETIESNKTTCE